MTSLGTSMGKGITAVGSVLGKAGSAVGSLFKGKPKTAQTVTPQAQPAPTPSPGGTQTPATSAPRPSIMSGIRNFFSGKPKAQKTAALIRADERHSEKGRRKRILQKRSDWEFEKESKRRSAASIVTKPAATPQQSTAQTATNSSQSVPAQPQSQPAVNGNGTQQAAQPKPAVASQPQSSPSPQVSTNNTAQTTQPKPATTSGTGGVTQQPAQSKPAEVPQPQKPQSGSTGGTQPQPQAQPNPAQPAQPKPQVTGGGTQQAQPKTTVNPQQQTQPGKVGQWFKNAGQRTWNGVKTAGKIGMIGGTAAAGLGAYALYKTATSDSDD